MSYKGKYKPKNPSKYLGNPTKVIYRSLWERRFMVFCDNNESVLSWGSEEVVVPYISPKDSKWHRYFVDFIVESLNKRGFKEVTLIEVKPKAQCKEPKKKEKPTRRYITEVMRWGVNSAKWKAAEEFAENRGWKFKILTEDHLFIKKKKSNKKKKK
ncbi:head completion protein [archaeon]|nr:head completion protein [archaeon]|tara:strand:- start:724 stop:1191 length:468 start_codon:yes stop_codon:yes gene_type:complete